MSRESNASNSCSIRYVRAAQQIMEPKDNDVTNDTELESSDSEDPDDSEDDAPPNSSEMGDFIEHTQLRGTLCLRHFFQTFFALPPPPPS